MMPFDTTITDRLRRDRSALLDALAEAGADVSKPNAIRCPFHDDAHPSAGVYTDTEGVERFKCHGCGAGGDIYDIRSRTKGTTPADELRTVQGSVSKTHDAAIPNARGRTYGTLKELLRAVRNLTAHYEYRNPETRVVDMVVVRTDPPGQPKRFLQAHQSPAGWWTMTAPPKPWPIYNRARTAKADRVVVVEGEKCVHALHDVEIVAATSPGGAGKARHADWSPLAGKECVLWPDADKPDANGRRTGIAHMRDVAKLLQSLDSPARVLWLDPDPLNLGEKGDCADFIDKLPTDQTLDQRRQAVEDVLLQATPTGPSAEVVALVSDAIAGRRRIIPWPWDQLGRATRALAPSTVTLLVASPGATKSLMLVQAAAWWHENGERVAVLELEDGRAFHLRRVLAQRAGESGLTDDEWCADNPDVAITATMNHAAFMDSLGACIHELPNDSQPTLEAIGDWIEQQAIAGKRIIAVDPLSIAEAVQHQYIADQKFIARAKRIVEIFGCSLLLVMHPKKHAQGRTTDDIAGGAAYGRLAQTVIWLEHTGKTQSVTVRDKTMGLPVVVEVNRIAHLVKTRIGRGQGLRIGYNFDSATLCLQEAGIITRQSMETGE
jgi:CHC2-type zinc finger protein